MVDSDTRQVELARRMDDLKTEFCAELETAHLQLRELAREIREDGVTGLPSAFSRLQKIAHRLAGSSGVFGFEEIGDAAAELDGLVLAKDCKPVAVAQSCERLIILIDDAHLATERETQLMQTETTETREKPSRITYVEDEADIREIGEIALGSIGGFTVDVCADGYAAVARTSKFRPDLIILDVMMPGMDGVETFKRLRFEPSLKDVPIVFMTARIQEDEIAQYRALGCVDVIAKPFDPIQLPDRIQKIWQQANDNRPLTTGVVSEQRA